MIVLTWFRNPPLDKRSNRNVLGGISARHLSFRFKGQYNERLGDFYMNQGRDVLLKACTLQAGSRVQACGASTAACMQDVIYRWVYESSHELSS